MIGDNLKLIVALSLILSFIPDIDVMESTSLRDGVYLKIVEVIAKFQCDRIDEDGDAHDQGLGTRTSSHRCPIEVKQGPEE